MPSQPVSKIVLFHTSSGMRAPLVSYLKVEHGKGGEGKNWDRIRERSVISSQLKLQQIFINFNVDFVR